MAQGLKPGRGRRHAIVELRSTSRVPICLCTACRQVMPELEFLLTLATGGAELHRLVEEELCLLGASAVERSGQARFFFRAEACPVHRFEKLHAPEKLYAIVLRQLTSSLELPPEGDKAEEVLAAHVAASSGWPAALDAWRLFTGRECKSSMVELPCSFRATGKRAGSLMAHLSSNGISALVGEAVAEAHGWEVDLTGFDLEVVVHLNDEMLVVALPLLERGSARQSHFACPGLTQPVAWAMARSAEIAPGEVVLDPMCGAGIILLEAAQCWREACYLGFDADPLQLQRSAANLGLLSGRTGHAVSLARAGVTCLPLAAGAIDAIVCDLPFGKLYGSEKENETLYPAALAEFRRVLKPGTGRAVLLTNQANAERLARALCCTAHPQLSWTVTCRRRLLLGNMEAVLFLAVARPSLGTGAPALPEESMRLPWEDGRGRAKWGALKAMVRPPLQPVIGGKKQLMR
uniref:THUMP domain-containing protein n=1 Tax=Pyrodinium bahamense TaxID=73915 RepID=A0A7S0A0H3_9DINO